MRANAILVLLISCLFVLTACGGSDNDAPASASDANADNSDNTGNDGGSQSGGSAQDEPHPLLGDLEANGGRNYAAVHCEGKADDEPLPIDPRELIAGENLNNPDYAVWYNDPFELCQTEALFENQRRQNELLGYGPDDPDRVYTAKPRPQTCGEWRTAVENGRKYIMHNAITGEVLTRDSIYNLAEHLGYTFPEDPQEANELLASIAQQRYGWPPHPYDNPFPMPGEDPNETDGGSLQLPIALVQTKDEQGNWTGKLGATCFACHIGQIGNGEVVGNSAKRDGHPELYGGSEHGTFVSLNGSNTDVGLALYDIERSNGKLGPNAFGTALNTPGYMANRTRGSNAADQEIVNVLLFRDLDTLDWRGNLPYAEVLSRLVPSVPATGGDQDMPTWWWTHNKTRYLWVGFGSAGSSRGNFFPSSTNPNDGHWSKRREGDYQDLDMWLNAVEAPAWPYGYCTNEDGSPAAGDDPNCINTPLAEAGAILFHSKDLWADEGNADIPRPPAGNGSCASCHGAYSPRFIHQEGFLPDPRLAGMSGATVPLDIVGTDPAQSNLFGGNNDSSSDGNSEEDSGGAVALLKDSWFAYPDALSGYPLPEEKPPFVEMFDDFGSSGGDSEGSALCELDTLGGYTAQPLHGVWASGPYFHNGSVPTVWDVLKPSDRPDVWLRQQVPESEASPSGERGFDTNMARAYDYTKLGWNYQTMSCSDLANVPMLNCSFNEQVPTMFEAFTAVTNVGADYFAAPYVQGPGQGEVTNRAIYNTNAYSKGNEGHEFTRVLTDQERRAIIEYLKTL